MICIIDNHPREKIFFFIAMKFPTNGGKSAKLCECREPTGTNSKLRCTLFGGGDIQSKTTAKITHNKKKIPPILFQPYFPLNSGPQNTYNIIFTL